MTKSGLLETRSNLSRIVDNVLHGEEHLILRKNIPVAKIVPLKEAVSSQFKELIARTKKIRQRTGATSIDEISAWKREGRR